MGVAVGAEDDRVDEPAAEDELFAVAAAAADELGDDVLLVVVAAAALAWARSAWADNRSAFSPAVSIVARACPAVTVSPTATFTPVT
ncbi:hypothetical protein AZH51_08435 [Branchiibius sp. NY16-3462-2]|nr:hypothetical protein AZH51_08435 [Branchiibius sp. NY16-3462-2]